MHFVMRSTELGWSAAFFATLLVVSLSDFLYRRIPNALSATVALMGCSYWLMHGGGSGLRFAILGMAAGFATMLVLYVLGFIAAGDVKIFAAQGASLGPMAISYAAVYGVLAGGVLSLWVIYHRRMSIGQLRQGMMNLHLGTALAQARQRGATVPYAAALCVGVLLAMGD